MLANGKITKCMEKEEYNGQMVKYMMEITKMIKNMAMVLLVGQMEGNMLANGKKENSMDEVSITYQMEVRKQDNGLKAKELNGFNKINEFSKKQIDNNNH